MGPPSSSVDAAIRRLWVTFGQQIRDARNDRRWTIAELARRASVSAGMAYRVETGLSASTATAVRLVAALGLRLDFEVSDPRRRSRTRADLSVDAVHSAMGEFEAEQLRLRTASFRALCPDPPDGFDAWWSGKPVPRGSSSALIVLDLLATTRQRPFTGLDDALTARPRYRTYADAATRLLARTALTR